MAMPIMKYVEKEKLEKAGIATIEFYDEMGLKIGAFEGPVEWSDLEGLKDDPFWRMLIRTEAPEWFMRHQPGPSWPEYLGIVKNVYRQQLRAKAFIAAVASTGPLNISVRVNVPKVVLRETPQE